MNSQIVHPELAEIGAQKIAWARAHMPVLGAIAERFREERPFEGKTLCVSVHLEAKTAEVTCSKEISDDMLKKAVEDAGYEVKAIE